MEHDSWSVTVRVSVNSAQITAGQSEDHLSQIVSLDGTGLLVEEDLKVSEAAQRLYTYPYDALPAHKVVVSCFKVLNMFFRVPLGSVCVLWGSAVW